MSGYQTRSNAERVPVRASLRGTDYPLGYQHVAVSTVSASGLTPPAGVRFALIQADGANIRWRDDGVAPTAAIGNRLLNAGTAQEYSGALSAVQLIAEGAGAFLNIAYYG
jgi:hypothetical protein